MNKSLPTETIKFDNVDTKGRSVEKVKIGKDGASMNKSIHRKHIYAQIVVGGKMRGDKLSSSNVMSGEK